MAKVRVNLKLFRKQLDELERTIGEVIEQDLKKEVIDSIERGVSPVKGQGRFDQYSESYKGIIRRDLSGFGKKNRPVNLKVSGVLLDSVFTEVKNNKVTIGFKDELFDIHNRQGAGKSKVVRRMLPTQTGEEFTRSITLRLRELIERKIKTIFKVKT